MKIRNLNGEKKNIRMNCRNNKAKDEKRIKNIYFITIFSFFFRKIIFFLCFE
jgi:hypothetical protein